jgi:hypothetical protein
MVLANDLAESRRAWQLHREKHERVRGETS